MTYFIGISVSVIVKIEFFADFQKLNQSKLAIFILLCWPKKSGRYGALMSICLSAESLYSSLFWRPYSFLIYLSRIKAIRI